MAVGAYELPLCWPLSKLGDCLSIIRNGTSKKQNRESLGLPVSRIETISDGMVNAQKAGYIEGLDEQEIDKYRLRSGDILFSHINSEPQLGRTAIYEGKPELLLHGMNLLLLRTRGKLMVSRFLHLLCAYLRIQGVFIALAGRAVGQSSINQGKLKRLDVPLPPLPEQRRIAAVLSLVQRAIEQQERLIALTTELKKALMHKLFTEGTRGEPQKQTEIGPIPKSWEVVPLGECCQVQTGIAKGRKVEPEEAVTLPYLRVANVQDGYLDLSEMKEITIRQSEIDRFSLRKDDLVLTEGGDLDKLGRGFIWRNQLEQCVHQNHVFVVRPHRNLISVECLAFLVQSPYGKAYFLSVAHKTTNLACINTTKLKGLPVLVPSSEEQKKITSILLQMDGKLRQHRKQQSLLNDLFRTLLHQLMTAEIRVNDLDLEELDILEQGV